MQHARCVKAAQQKPEPGSGCKWTLPLCLCRAGPYRNGTLNTTSCPAGTVPIGTEAVCETAALAMGLSYRSHSAPKYPKGCYVRTKDAVYFNVHGTGGVDAQSQPLCITECPFEGNSSYRYDCQTAPCSCRKGQHQRAYSFYDGSSAQKECFTCVPCAFSPRDSTSESQDDSLCARSFGNFTSAQQCANAVANIGTFSAARFSSVDGGCSGCTSRFPQYKTINADAYEFYTCNFAQGKSTEMISFLD
jgi:hypothetical protein